MSVSKAHWPEYLMEAAGLGSFMLSACGFYFTAPPIGMLVAAEIYQRLKGASRVACAKLHHHNNHRCIFNCNFKEILIHE